MNYAEALSRIVGSPSRYYRASVSPRGDIQILYPRSGGDGEEPIIDLSYLVHHADVPRFRRWLEEQRCKPPRHAYRTGGELFAELTEHLVSSESSDTSEETSWDFRCPTKEVDGKQIIQDAVEAGAGLLEVLCDGHRLALCSPEYAQRIMRLPDMDFWPESDQHLVTSFTVHPRTGFDLVTDSSARGPYVWHMLFGVRGRSAAELHSLLLAAERRDAAERTHVRYYR